ncbi:VOC family protein [Nocardioides mesophilus]|uniref:VOC family protein n=1 Tax=Nocardioides mesophilus TaxID=433659 RepID=A0A7G9RFK1_9ACTN|nr:VOC family protein [Nocardioides mesophilus]QNN54376.1 VOC family protein [Nocardioides mesophilus]
MTRTTTCLWFDRGAEEAARFYVSVFPGSRITGVTPAPENAPGGTGEVLAVTFELDGAPFVALNGRPDHAGFTEAISIQVDCADQAEVDHYWSRLGGGGEESRCGWLRDRYGLSWQVVPRRLPELLGDPDPEVAGRVMATMLTMGKLEIEPLEAAAREATV